MRFGSIDDALGDRATRFFAEGFKQVDYSLTEVRVEPQADPARITAVAEVQLPDLWSRKGGHDQRPHLSTIDAMILSARLGGLYLAHTHGLDAGATFLVRSLAIKAGKAPDEDDLDRLAVEAVHHGAHLRADVGVGEPLLTTLECRLGAMTARVGLEHNAGTASHEVAAPARYAHHDELPGPWNDAPFGLSHRLRSQHLNDVQVDLADLSASARLDLVASAAAEREPVTTTMIDLFVSALQLGQVLLYCLDGVSRAESSTLWMRSTTLTTTGADPSRAGDRIEARLAQTNLLPTAQGTWRTARIAAAHGAHAVTCNVTHLLP